MFLVLALLLVAFIVIVFLKRRRRRGASGSDEASTELDAWVADVLENELASKLGVRGDDRRARELSRTLRGNPDPEHVGHIEELVRSVDVQYVRYAGENDAALTVTVRYEDGSVATAQRRIALDAIPTSVRRALTEGGATQAFRGWDFPWAR